MQYPLARLLRALVKCLMVGSVTALAAQSAEKTIQDNEVRKSAGYQHYWVEQMAEGLAFPSAIAWLPSGDALITERAGGLRVLRSGELGATPIKGLPEIFHNSFADGLKDILLDPDYAANQFIYLLISEGTFTQRHAAVYRARYSKGGLTNLECIFRSKDDDPVLESGTMGSRMIFLADKTLLVAVAEEFKDRAQRLDSHKGKIVRIHRDGSIPKDNPFVNTPEALPEIWSYGHRVVLGLHLESETGELWAIESGPRGGDELNILKAGGNFGWPRVGWGFKYNNSGAWASEQFSPGIEDPILIWTPSVTPAGLTRYHGDIYPQWDGDYFVGHLTKKELERLRFEGHRIVLQERMLVDIEERIREVKVGPDNHIYLLTDHQNGRVLRLRTGNPLASERRRVARKLDRSWGVRDTYDVVQLELGDPVKGQQAFMARCAACHRVGTAIPGGDLGPDLANVYGRRAGRAAGFNYSKVLTSWEMIWNAFRLYEFLTDPSGFAPGTTMTAPPVTDAEERRQIIAFLKQHSGN